MVLGSAEAVELFRGASGEPISLGRGGEQAELQYVEGRGRRLARSPMSPQLGSR